MLRADVYKGSALAATLGREPDGVTAFSYLPDYLADDEVPVATSLPLTEKPRITPAGAVPPFFAGLLPEGRRLEGLRRSIKASADDELSLLLEIGADLVGDVRVVPEGTVPVSASPIVNLSGAQADLSFSALLAERGIVDRVGIAGVQDKVSAKMISLPVAREGERYILKLSPPEYPHVVENEAFFLDLAKEAGLPTADAVIINDAEGVAGLLVTRFDRLGDGTSLAMEDACQVLDLWPADKYNVTMEDVALAVVEQCAAKPVAALAVYRQIVFAWLTGNGDLHAKNLSILQTRSGEWRVSPAYDLPSTVIYDDLTFALDINGEDRNVTRRDLDALAAAIGLPPRAAQTALTKISEATRGFADRLASLPFGPDAVTALDSELQRRRTLLGL